MAVEKYIAIASLGLFIMFVGEIITIFEFMINPPESISAQNVMFQFEPAPKILQFISIGIAPAVILAGVSFIMAKRYGSKLIGSFIISGGAILLVGMIYAYTLLDEIPEEFLVPAVTITPPLFMLVSIPTMVIGGLLFRIKTKRPKKEYF